jgi:hypothetical protein
MEEIREAIVDGRFDAYRSDFHRRFTPPDEHVRRDQKRKWLLAQGRRPDHARQAAHGRQPEDRQKA